jgi:hypothetical protein
MHVTGTFTGDGLLALAGGALAFIAVMIQTRSGSRGLQKQLDDENSSQDSVPEYRMGGPHWTDLLASSDAQTN